MKKVVLSLLLLSAVLLSAVNPGLPESDLNIVKQFRLPAWGYEGYGLKISGIGYNKSYDVGRYYREENQLYSLLKHVRLPYGTSCSCTLEHFSIGL